MKIKLLLRNLAIASLLIATNNLSAQCGVTISCPGNSLTTADSNNCSAVVNFTAPVGTNTCSTSSTQTFNFVTASLQTFTVPAGVTSIHIDASGAQGGSVTTTCAATGGLGARMEGDFAVTPGEVLSIMVGEQGLTNGSDAGGGGGSFVVRTGNVLLVAAGGGGGATNNITACGANRNGINATITTSGTASGNGLVAGGINGNGGGASSGSGGGGGGFLTNGIAGTGFAGNNGKSYLNGGAGGNGNNNDRGGYGGGGAGWFTGGNGGGGGGYSGGATSGSQPFTGGGGGGSYSIGTNQNNVAGFQSGNGRVIISYNVSGPATTTMTQGMVSGSSFPVGTTLQQYVVSDGSGGTDTCSFTITVTDAQAPVMTCPANITVNADSGMCSAIASFSAPVASDNCILDTTSQTAGPISGSAFPVGTTTVSYMAMDLAGNMATCSFTVTVNDIEAPMFTCPGNLAVNADSGMCSAVVNFNMPNAIDNCSIASVTQTAGLTSGSAFPLGTSTVSFTATDSAGNSSACSYDIIVTDVEAPTFTCPGNITVPNDSTQCSAIVNFSLPTAIDNCSGATVVQTGGPTSGFSFAVGNTTITFTATDLEGNSSTCSFDIIVTDVEAPTLTCPGNAFSCNGNFTGIGAFASDQCSSAMPPITYVLTGATTASGSGDASAETFNVGVTTVTYTATDITGNNSTSCSFTVTVFGSPSLTLSASSNTVCLDDASVVLTGSPAGGTWSGTGVTGSTFDPSVPGNGTHTPMYSYVDTNGCTATGTVSIVVNPCVGVEETVASSFAVYPNPTDGQINIQLGRVYNHVEILVTEINGKLVLDKQYNSTNSVNMSMEDLAAGIYYVTIKADDTIQVVKLIRQ
jgi:HYR domain/Secretion system C-terminal sorting domain